MRCAALLVLLASPALAAEENELFQGLLVAATAVDQYAPEFTFRVGGWQSDWGNRKILELAPDGKPVKKGDVIARFEFGAKDALQWIKDRVRRAEADAQQSKLNADQQLEALQLEQRRKEIEAQLAGLDLGKERAIAKRTADLYRILQKLSLFEVDAARQRMEAARSSRDAERDYQDKNVERQQNDLKLYAFYENRFNVVAPRDGVVRHAFNPRERRKFQKGDNVQSGQKIVSLATDTTLAVRFYVPEHRIKEVKPGQEVTVTTPSSAEELTAKVVEIDFFPQELSFLLENDGLPNGREKAFAVKAELQGSAGKLAAGSEVKVKARR